MPVSRARWGNDHAGSFLPAGLHSLAILCPLAVLVIGGCEKKRNALPPPVDTTISEPPPAILSGELSYPSDYIPKDMHVCAERAEGGKPLCEAKISSGANTTYKLEVPAGRYRVYARTSAMPGYKAYYTDAVVCGLSVECSSHEPVLVEVKPGKRRERVDPQDWYTGG
jgi:hypothetical protein